MDDFALLVDSLLLKLIPIVALKYGAHLEHAVCAFKRPAHATSLHSVFDQMAASAFDDAGCDRVALCKVLVIAHIYAEGVAHRSPRSRSAPWVMSFEMASVSLNANDFASNTLGCAMLAEARRRLPNGTDFTCKVAGTLRVPFANAHKSRADGTWKMPATI